VSQAVLDLKGLSCPLPVLKANKALKQMAPGDVLTVHATDPAAPRDFEVLCDNTGDQLTSCTDDGKAFTIVVTKGVPRS